MNKYTAEQVRDVHWNMAKEYKAIPALAEPHQAMGDAIDALLRERESAKAVVTDEMVNRFLSWKLPDDFRPDAGISFDRSYSDAYPACWPVGTNLLTADQARTMLEHVIGEAPMLASARVPDRCPHGIRHPHPCRVCEDGE